MQFLEGDDSERVDSVQKANGKGTGITFVMSFLSRERSLVGEQGTVTLRRSGRAGCRLLDVNLFALSVDQAGNFPRMLLVEFLMKFVDLCSCFFKGLLSGSG